MDKATLKSKLFASVDHLKTELVKIRTGRASPALIEDVTVDVYNSKMKVKELATISVPEPQSILVSPWDKAITKDIDKAIRVSELGLNPVNEGDALRVHIPQLTEERRKELARAVSERVEECRKVMRNIRQEAMKAVDKLFEEKELGEDEKFSRRDDVAKLTREFTDEAEALGEAKKKDLMTV